MIATFLACDNRGAAISARDRLMVRRSSGENSENVRIQFGPTRFGEIGKIDRSSSHDSNGIAESLAGGWI